ncbi:radical SAM protein [Desulfatibacillum aliphaticivorans]|uniref:7-carboxy-7-deazaguanine synthase n=1 Tax=Desulfatibacillum aliphaticivorans TaxID=218208 RepID=B8FMW5_DESAL|nr:radical SAM protein [Desulfatibacillum aliphaticivorans]ACL05835.1 Radical SAM domain protein [Desulfatibacillum aliphaticivorans]
MALDVCEIFYGIQGESTYQGMPCVFIRLSGCNLRCRWCDTGYAYDAGLTMSISEIMEKAGQFGCPIVEVTGGEPLLQKETPALVDAFLNIGLLVLLETNGSQDIAKVDSRCIRIVDVKCPSSGMEEHNDYSNLSRMTEKDELKFVIASREDYEFARKRVRLLDFDGCRMNAIHFSPVFGELDPKTLAEWILQDRLEVRLHLQMHKFIWGKDARGV